MLVVYASRTGNVRRFVEKLTDDFRIINVDEVEEIYEPFVLVTYTDGFGSVPNKVSSFLERNDNYKNLKGVASSGNIVWQGNFGKSANLISEKYNVPIILKFEVGGRKKDLELFKERVLELDEEIH